MSTIEPLPVSPGSTSCVSNPKTRRSRALELFSHKVSILVACTLVGATVGAIWYMSVPPRFQAISTVTLSAGNEIVDESDPAFTLRTLEGSTTNWNERVLSDAVLNRVISRLTKD